MRKIFGFSRKYTYTLLKKKDILSFRIANSYCIPKVFIIEYLHELEEEAEEERREPEDTEVTDSATKST